MNIFISLIDKTTLLSEFLYQETGNSFFDSNKIKMKEHLDD